MRRLIYVPIIHSDADMGSLAAALEQSATKLCGEQRWARHQVTTTRFWQIVSHYLETRDAKGLKVYQDGFVPGADRGRKLIEAGMKQGSPNYEIIFNLINRGAEVMPAEDMTLLNEEYQHISRIAQAETPAREKTARREYAARQAQLTAARDRFIAGTINKTLGDGEVGLLLMGAYHDVIPYLAQDITVVPLKDRETVKAYFAELISGGDERLFEQLTDYLSAPVDTGAPRVDAKCC